jgi:hypothetical protein
MFEDDVGAELIALVLIGEAAFALPERAVG